MTLSRTKLYLVAVLFAVSLSYSVNADAQSVLFRNVSIIPMDTERVIEGKAVLVQDGIISAIGDYDTLVLPENTEVVDGNGGFLLPGLSDMHAHIAGYAGVEGTGGNAAVAQNQLLLYAASGVTTLRDPSGTEAHFEYRRRLESGDWTGPRLVFTSNLIEGENALWPFSTKITEPDAIEPLFAKLAERGYWGVKLYHTISADVYRAAIGSAEKHGLMVVGHVPFSVGIEGALAAKQYSIEHFRGYDFDGLSIEDLEVDGGRNEKRFSVFERMTEERSQELVSLTLAAGVWNDPTLVINAFLFDIERRQAVAKDRRIDRVHPELRRQFCDSSELDAIFSDAARAALRRSFPKQLAFVKRLNDVGAKLLIGTDTIIPAYVPGFGVLDEMRFFQAAQLSSFDILRIATVNAADSLGLGDSSGRIAIGMSGDMVLVSGNPLESLDVFE